MRALDGVGRAGLGDRASRGVPVSPVDGRREGADGLDAVGVRVNVATVKLVRVREVVVMGPDTTMVGSDTEVLAMALLLAVFGSAVVAVTVAELVRVPSSNAWAVTVKVTLVLRAIVPMLNVTTPFDWLKVPWLAVADTYEFASSVSVKTTPVAGLGPLFVTVTV